MTMMRAWPVMRTVPCVTAVVAMSAVGDVRGVRSCGGVGIYTRVRRVTHVTMKEMTVERAVGDGNEHEEPRAARATREDIECGIQRIRHRGHLHRVWVWPHRYPPLRLLQGVHLTRPSPLL